MKSKLQSISIGVLISFNLFADGFIEATSQDQPWTITASFGHGTYQRVHNHDSQNVLARLALGNELGLSGDIALGVEFGIQNGNRMRLNIPEETLSVLGWLPPIKSNLGPMLDLLVTAKSNPLFGSSFFAQMKGGLAYRHWKVPINPVNNLSQLAGEIQAGFGYPITALASLNLLYQGVYGSDPNLKINFETRRGSVSNIPILHGFLLGLTVNI
ncbi:hypothetical protein [Legionella waltersii]|uniref:Outer membrane protein beta-barrel domain-containing protein n=1 Tax=Legionella waltersii TaxID=66969 RepID=A0A0W1ANM3_9GAMM|nr:hypothetical protein [Legionella waltersii]KTD82866.1 hypothetical protein Lwal_0344 [Legionella waltersii]SNV01932.1 Uncharacterised protein [Legionella waltersii]